VRKEIEVESNMRWNNAVLRGDLPRLARTTSIVTSTPSVAPTSNDTPSHTDIKRSKPLKYAYEKEIVLYAHHKKLDYFSTECIYSPEAFRGSARALIKNLERIRPSAILDVVRSGEDMAKLVPGANDGPINGCGGKHTTVEDEEGACGSSHGRSAGGEMALMEKQLVENDMAASKNLEMDVASVTSIVSLENLPIRRGNGRPLKQHVHAPPKVVKQTMGQCERCGYLSSQPICKACTLLEGLNKSRPRTEINIVEAKKKASDQNILVEKTETPPVIPD
jgi:cytoplasmic tRNA 2-thiolation protein 1